MASICRICKEANVTVGCFLPDVCYSCQAKVASRYAQAVEARHGVHHEQSSLREAVGNSSGTQQGGSQGSSSSGTYGTYDGRGAGVDASSPGVSLGARIKAGDFVEKVTKAIGIPACGGCGKRRDAMNTVDMSKPAFQVLMGLAEAITTPEKALSKNGIQKNDQTSEGSTKR